MSLLPVGLTRALWLHDFGCAIFGTMETRAHNREQRLLDSHMDKLVSNEQQELLFPVLSHDEIMSVINHSDFPINRFVGNSSAVNRYREASYDGLSRNNHNVSSHQFSVIGPPSSGKTYLVRLFAEGIGLPFIEIEPMSIRSVDDIHGKIADELNKNPSLVLPAMGDIHYPSCVVFIDEVHNLRSSVVQGLLKATERSDCTMVLSSGQVCDTSRICWQIATTDRGDLFDAFDTRFEKVVLHDYTKSELSRIIQLSTNSSDEVSNYASFYSSIPREGIAFAKSMSLKSRMNPSLGLSEIALSVASDHGIDPLGMSYKRLEVLSALRLGPLSAERLANQVRVKVPELRRFILPSLLSGSTGMSGEPLITISSRGYVITDYGLQELLDREV